MFRADLCAMRQALAATLSMHLVVMGWLSYCRLGLDLLLKLEGPAVAVSDRLAGINPEEAQPRVTKAIEATESTIEGLDELRSRASEGACRVTTSSSWPTTLGHSRA